jgi:hypothetical protein
MARIFYIIVKLDLKPNFPQVSEQSLLERVCGTLLGVRVTIKRFHTFAHIFCQNDPKL